MYIVEECDLFGQWQSMKQFDDLDDAVDYCRCMADMMGIDTRIIDRYGQLIDGGQTLDEFDLDAMFYEIENWDDDIYWDDQGR